MPPSRRTALSWWWSTAAAVLVAASVTTSQVAAAAEVTPVVYVDWSDRFPLAGQRTVVEGVLGPVQAGQVVHLDRYDAALDRWVPVAQQEADVDGYRGSFSFRLRHDRAGRRAYRVRATAADATLSSPSATVVTGGQRRALTSRWSDGVADRGQSGVTVSGALAGGGARTVVLQVRAGDRWVDSVRTTSRAGRYRVPVATSSYGTFRHRLVAPVTARQRAAGLTRAVSAVKAFRVTRPWAPGPLPDPLQRPSTALGDPADFSYISSTRARWNPCSTITYRVNAADGPAGALQDTKGAVTRIELATGLDLEYVGATGIVPQDSQAENYPADTQIVIAWASQSQSALISQPAVAGVGGPMGWGGTLNDDGEAILTWRRGTVVLNSAFNDVLDPGFGDGTTVGKLLMHEIGHVVGLGHAAGETQVMFPTLQREYPTAWGAGDLSGLRSQGAGQGCIYEKDGSAPSFRRTRVSVVSRVIADNVAGLD